MDASQKRHMQKQKILQIACFSLAVLACLPVPLIVPNLLHVVDNLDLELSFITVLYIKYYGIFYLFASFFGLLMLAGMAQTEADKVQKFTTTAVLSLIFSFVMVVVSIIALQMPIYQLVSTGA